MLESFARSPRRARAGTSGKGTTRDGLFATWDVTGTGPPGRSSPADEPASLSSGSMAYDGGDQLILFGGGTAVLGSDGTYEYPSTPGPETGALGRSSPAASRYGRSDGL